MEKNVKKVLACSGQVYYTLINERTKLQNEDIAIIALEQIAPFPYKEFYDAIIQFPDAKIFWTQEEHMNSGAWSYVEPRINNLLNQIKLKNNKVTYIGRPTSSAPAAGHMDQHEKELKNYLKESFNKL